MKFTDIRLLVKDFDKCFDFYKNKLKLESTWGDFGDSYASFNVGYDSVITLFKSELMMQAIGEEYIESNNASSKFVLVIRVDNLEAKYKELLASGLAFINKPTEMPGWGDCVVHLKDPEGNLIELCEDLDVSKWNNDLLKDREKYSK